MNRFACLLVSLMVAAASPAATGEYSPYATEAFPRQLLWGDTHLHSSLSADAFGLGVRLGPEEAFRFARGETVTSTWGLKARLSRPLDFVVLADHAESLGLMRLLHAGDARLLEEPELARWHALLHGTPAERRRFSEEFFVRETRQTAFGKLGTAATPGMRQAIWHDALAAAERHNQPGLFTTLLGFEWTSAPGGSNLHRVVIFRDSAARVGQVMPLSSRGDAKPDELWNYLTDYEAGTGGQVMAIPHNGNLSNGLMFPTGERYGGEPVDADYARRRARWEPVVEVTQIKGDGETHALLSPDDEFADYETWDAGNFEGAPKTENMLAFEYARASLKNGLSLGQRLGINPYAFGMIGATDSHTALAAVEENNFFGKHSSVEPDPNRLERPVGHTEDGVVHGWQQASSGYAAVWAADNTREAVWDALKRREVYATTGSRIGVRFFGGWEFAPSDALAPDLAAVGYERGVPMGGVLPAPRSKGPRFLFAASKDAIGANLDRVQMVKGWVDGDGAVHERVYDIAWSPREGESDAGALAPVGTTVDVAKATWQNSIGAAQLQGVWEDPHFDASQPAFYYLRVLEIPTPRWTAYDAARFGVAMPDGAATVTQERAYTSPIWYSPR